jgi:uncharacterized NAD(P)/FAD-binding protein YdhS
MKKAAVVTKQASGDAFDVAIIGGGAAGVLVALHLLKAPGLSLRIAMVEPRSKLGEGAAYSTAYPEHLLNVIAARMSVFDDDPDHFVRYLTVLHGETCADVGTAIAYSFARRLDFACYLRATLEEVSKETASSLHWLSDEAIDIEGAGPCAIKLRSGGAIQAQRVVLASGNFPRALPLPDDKIRGRPRIDSAWDYDAIRALDPGADICIIGSGLSMVDTVMSLNEVGHNGRITVMSRHGLMPLSHAAHGSQQGVVDDLLGLGLSARIRALRARAKTAMQAGDPWQWTMDRLRPHGQALWRSLSRVDQHRFLRHFARIWDIHRHRIAPIAATRIEALRQSGRLSVRAGRLISINSSGVRSEVHFSPKGGVSPEVLRVDRVINSTGVESNLRRMDSDLLQALQARRMVMSGPHGIGLATDDTGALIAADGSVQPGLFTLGASRIGLLWESIAIPELRRQAQDLSRHLLGRALRLR